MYRCTTGLRAAACIALWGAFPVCAPADAIFKSVDAEGRVTYSSTPPAAGSAKRVEEMQIAPTPPSAGGASPAQRARTPDSGAEERQRLREAAAKERSERIAAAQQDLIRAKAELEQAKIQGDGDWQYLVRGGRVLSESYFQRITAAEARVQAAEKALQGARRGP